ncbi:MAG TPA: response regulator [Gemmataceae bacterium]|nr:response regulator [Gemmataceae bacterium]
MLVLSRRLHEKIVFPGIAAKVQIVSIKSGVVRLGIEAPPDVPVLREELPDRHKEWGSAAGAKAAEEPLARVQQLLRNRLRVTGVGLSQLRRQLREGSIQDAEMILAEIEEDLQLLQTRVGTELSRPAAPERPRSRSCKALVVEDDHNECELLAGFLRLAGLEVATADDGADALDYLKTKGRPDVLLLDMLLPRCDGPTTVRRIRSNPAYAGMKIYGVSGHTPERFDLAIGAAGVDGWFQKPVNPESLLHDLCPEVQPA